MKLIILLTILVALSTAIFTTDRQNEEPIEAQSEYFFDE